MASPAQDAAALLLLLHLLCFGPSIVVSEYTSQSLSMHLDTLLAEYDREVAPPPAASDSAPVGADRQAAVNVALSLDVRHAAVDDDAATMRMLADLKMSWSDPRLTWNATEWETESVPVSAERLWTPDVTLQSAGGGGGAGDAALRARLHAAGVTLVLRLDLTVPIALDTVHWPRDVQEAVFKFASRVHNEREIKLVVEDYKNALVVETGAWEVVSVTGSETSVPRGDEGAASAAQWSVRAARRNAAAATAAGAALAAAVLLLAAAAALPYTRRAPLAAVAAFIAANWLMSAIYHVPASSSTPRAMSVMCAVCVCGAASGAAAAAAARLARLTCAPPAALRALLSRISAVYVLAPDPEQQFAGVSGAWAAAARLLDAAAVLALAVTILVLVAVY